MIRISFAHQVLVPPEPRIHRGMVFHDKDGWWRYVCTECDYGAGSRVGSSHTQTTWNWLMRLAEIHGGDMEHYSRRRSRYTPEEREALLSELREMRVRLREKRGTLPHGT